MSRKSRQSDYPDHYSIDAFCRNCKWRGQVWVLKGHWVRDALEKTVRCPNCGVLGLIQIDTKSDHEAESMNWRINDVENQILKLRYGIDPDRT